MRRSIAGLVAVAVFVVVVPASAGPLNVVMVRNNRFEPEVLHIAPGDTVHWAAMDGGHTVTAEDGRFSFPSSGGLREGEVVSWTFEREETVSYWCRVHAPGMRGTIVVGAGTPPPPVVPTTRTVPSVEFPTIPAALKGARPGTKVEVLPGEYHYDVSVTTSDVTIRGMGSSPADVVIDGDDRRSVGITARADRLRVENLTVREHGVAGISFDGARGFAGSRVHALDNGLTGISAVGASSGRLTETLSRGSRTGIALGLCESCDVSLSAITVEGNSVGVAVVNGAGISLDGSSVRNNGLGVALEGDPALEPRHLRNIQVSGNTIVDNANTSVPAPHPTGLGIWISSGSHIRVFDNTVSGHRYGVAVTATGEPSIDNRVVNNVLDGSTVADVGWDGVGADVCLGENRRSDGSEVTTDPPLATTVYSCGLPHTVGIPWPLVTARVLLS